MTNQPNKLGDASVLYVRCTQMQKLLVIQHARKKGLKAAVWATDVLMRAIEQEAEGERK